MIFSVAAADIRNQSLGPLHFPKLSDHNAIHKTRMMKISNAVPAPGASRWEEGAAAATRLEWSRIP